MKPIRARRGRGFALMMAIFIIVTLAAIGIYLLTISTGQLQAASQDEQGVRAYRAARAGIEWAAYQVVRNPSGTFATNCAAASASQSIALTAPQLSGFRFEVACLGKGEAEAGVAVTIFQVTVTGCNGSPSGCGTSVGPTYVERQLQITLTR